MKFSEIRSQLRPLDLIFFNGKDGVSDFIKWVQRKQLNIPTTEPVFSHVALVVTPEILDKNIIQQGNIYDNHIYLFESTLSGSKYNDNVPNIIGHSFLGVQMRDFDEVCKYYLADESCIRMAWARLDVEINPSDFKEKFTKIFNQLNGTRYDGNPISLASTVFSCLRCIRPVAEIPSENWLFCSELVATVYKELGIYPESVHPKNTAPMDLLGKDSDSLSAGGVPSVLKLPTIDIELDA